MGERQMPRSIFEPGTPPPMRPHGPGAGAAVLGLRTALSGGMVACALAGRPFAASGHAAVALGPARGRAVG